MTRFWLFGFLILTAPLFAARQRLACVGVLQETPYVLVPLHQERDRLRYNLELYPADPLYNPIALVFEEAEQLKLSLNERRRFSGAVADFAEIGIAGLRAELREIRDARIRPPTYDLAPITETIPTPDDVTTPIFTTYVEPPVPAVAYIPHPVVPPPPPISIWSEAQAQGHSLSRSYRTSVRAELQFLPRDPNAIGFFLP